MTAWKHGCITAAAILALLVGCQSVRHGDGMRFHNWWNYYERSQERMAAGRYELAVQDLRKALGLDPGARRTRDRDDWRARTYGMHFVDIDGYFPNRELGVAYYRLGQMDEAIEFLERSLGQTPSGRAKYFLNQARQKKIFLAGSIMGQTGVAQRRSNRPRVSFDPAPPPAWARERTITLSGQAWSEDYVRSVSVGGIPSFIELASAKVSFAQPVGLVAGTNIIPVVAENLAGETTTSNIVIVADFQPPAFTVDSVRREADGWRIEGVFIDDHRVQFAAVGPHVVRRAESTDVAARASFAVTLPDGPVAIEAEDAAGNRLASLFDAADIARRTTARAPMFHQTADAAGLPVPPAPAEPQDRMRPTVTLSTQAEHITVERDTFAVEIKAEDYGGLASLTINGEPLLPAAERGKIHHAVTRNVSLEMNENAFEIEAADMAGNRTVRHLTVVRRIPPYLERDIRLKVGLPPAHDPTRSPRALKIDALAFEALTRDPVRFFVLDRDDGNWDRILTEHQLSLSNLAGLDKALDHGKLQHADLLLVLNVIPRDIGADVVGRLVDTADRRVVIQTDVYDPGGEQDLATQIDGLVQKLEQRFPLREGRVIEDARGFAIDLGQRHGIPAGARFIVIDADNRILTDGETPVELIAHDVRMDQSGINVITPRTPTSAIKHGDRVFTR